MLSFITKLFGKPASKAVLPAASVHRYGDAGSMMPTVEVVHLSLPAILGRLPEDLLPLVLNHPAAEATVALPLPTIIKQLPSGGVKISLASLHRQAPPGVLGPLPPGDKRLVEVPLSEIFKHVSPSLLKRRSDQRAFEEPAADFSLFGNTPNPYELAEPAPAPQVVAPATVEAAAPSPLILAPHGEAAFPPPDAGPAARLGSPPTPAARMSLAPTAEFAAAMHRKAPPAKNEGPSLSFPLAPLAAAWPEEIRNELAALNGSATVALPTGDVTAGLAKGKVTFTWGQIRAWVSPELSQPSSVEDSAVLILPLKVVAPVFLSATRRPKPEAPPADLVDETIPTLFNSSAASGAKAAAVEAPASLPEAAPSEAAAPAASGTEPAASAALAAPHESPISSAAALAPQPVAASVGQALGQPEKLQWTPGEMVAAVAKFPGVAGAVVALQEGLLVAEAISTDMKGEVFAAFLPQIFARLNQYAKEMHLGEVDDILFTTKGAHCQIYRLGFIYFAVLGKPGEALPWTELRLVADELTRQTQKEERTY